MAVGTATYYGRLDYTLDLVGDQLDIRYSRIFWIKCCCQLPLSHCGSPTLCQSQTKLSKIFRTASVLIMYMISKNTVNPRTVKNPLRNFGNLYNDVHRSRRKPDKASQQIALGYVPKAMMSNIGPSNNAIATRIRKALFWATPRCWPHSAFRMLYAQVELSEKPSTQALINSGGTFGRESKLAGKAQIADINVFQPTMMACAKETISSTVYGMKLGAAPKNPIAPSMPLVIPGSFLSLSIRANASVSQQDRPSFCLRAT